VLGVVTPVLGQINVEHHTVNTSFAAGTISYPPDLGRPDSYVVTAGTELSDELIDLIGQSRPEAAGPFAPLLAGLPSAGSNLEFLTGDLTLFGNAGQLIVDMAPVLADALAAEACGTFEGRGVATFTGREAYSLLGGYLAPDGSVLWIPPSPPPENIPPGSTLVVGTAKVDFYTVAIRLTRVGDCPAVERAPALGGACLTLLAAALAIVGLASIRRLRIQG